MSRTAGLLLTLLVAMSGFAQQRPSPKTRPMFIATTGRIVAVATTNETVFQDGADPIRFEDFKIGETISVHGR